MLKVKPYLELFVGGMFAGKTTALQAKGKRHSIAGQSVFYVKPKIDDRYSASKIVTHDGSAVVSKVLNTEELYCEAMESGSDVILVDEVQFFGADIVSHILMLVEAGKTVYCSGLDLDYQGQPFEITTQLMAYANKVNKMTAVCTDCGEDAFVTVKTTDSNYRIEVGGADKYKPLCRECFYNQKLK
ncbi:thymidine kinase [Rummeliibacillus stabekisii]|uniref:thymidine kinase n=1 Tax=Rummeliibacillus stabekisii TaxID=241244 RepID=UPI003711D7BF